MVVLNSSILLALFALSAKVIATPPACLLAAVKYEPAPPFLRRTSPADSLLVAQRRIPQILAQSAVSTLLKSSKRLHLSVGTTRMPLSLHFRAPALALARPFVR